MYSGTRANSQDAPRAPQDGAGCEQGASGARQRRPPVATLLGAPGGLSCEPVWNETQV